MPLVHAQIVILRQLRDLDELAAKPLAGLSRRQVIRAAGNINVFQPVPFCKLHQQAAGLKRVMSPAVRLIDGVADVANVIQPLVMTYAKVAKARLLAFGVEDIETVRRHPFFTGSPSKV